MTKKSEYFDLDEICKYDFDYPDNLISLDPLKDRQKAKMLVSNNDGFIHDEVGKLTDYISKKDLLVFNNTKVIPCRLKAKKNKDFSAIDIEVTLNKFEHDGTWSSFCMPGRKLKEGDKLHFARNLFAEVSKKKYGLYFLKFNKSFTDLLKLLDQIGEMPIPPYILKKRGFRESDFENYQTSFAKNNGSVAAPTASLHFDKKLFNKIKEKKIPYCFVTLHVSGGTFIPIKSKTLSDHIMHSEFAKVGSKSASKIRNTLDAGGRIIAVGTTTLRVLESNEFFNEGQFSSFEKDINTFIKPGHKFKVCSGLLTNFHQPKSTLFVLVNAFIGIRKSKSLYQEAIIRNYRLFSYGDCCLLFT